MQKLDTDKLLSAKDELSNWKLFRKRRKDDFRKSYRNYNTRIKDLESKKKELVVLRNKAEKLVDEVDTVCDGVITAYCEAIATGKNKLKIKEAKALEDRDLSHVAGLFCGFSTVRYGTNYINADTQWWADSWYTSLLSKIDEDTNDYTRAKMYDKLEPLKHLQDQGKIDEFIGMFFLELS